MVVELGRLVYDVKVEKVKVGNDEKSVLNNRIAISLGKDKTTFVDIVAWGGTAELIGKHFKKGNEIYVEGHLINKTKKKDNVEFDGVTLNIDSIKFTNGNKEKEEPPFLD